MEDFFIHHFDFFSHAFDNNTIGLLKYFDTNYLYYLVFISHTNYLFFYSFFSDGCCSTLRLSTEGIANSSQSVRLGIYERVDTFSDRPVYLHSDVDEYIFYMGGRARGLWMVGPSVGTFR